MQLQHKMETIHSTMTNMHVKKAGDYRQHRSKTFLNEYQWIATSHHLIGVPLVIAFQLFLTRNIPSSGPFSRCRVPVGSLRAIGAREGHVGREHLKK